MCKSTPTYLFTFVLLSGCGVESFPVTTILLYRVIAPRCPFSYRRNQSPLQGHSNANLDGFKEIVRTNDGGNNIICYVTNGVEQGAPSGTATNLRLRYTVAETVDPENYVVGELADFSGHSAGTNNGFLPIVAINEGGGNNVVILNATNGGGAVQAGAGGNVNTRRMVVSTGVDPDTLIEVGDLVKISGRAQSTQNGNFEVKLVKKFTLNNFVIYLGSLNNSSGAGGTYTTEKKIVTFREDFSAFYVAGESKVQLEGIADGAQDVTEINRGGFSNYNVVIKAIDLNEQLPAAGRVAREIRSIFLTRPRLEYIENKPRNLQVDSSATFKVGGVEADTILTLEIIEVPEGLPSTLVLSLS